MKKTFVLLLGMLFVLGFVANSFAINADIPSETQAAVAKGTTQVTLDGELRVRGWLRDNVGNALPTNQSTDAFYDSRVRLGVEAKVTKGTTGYVQLESGSVPATDTYVWGSGAATTSTGNLTVNDKPNTTLNILQAWILHTGSGLLGVPAGVKVGHMPLALGQKQFLDHTKYGDDALVFFTDPVKGLHIGVLTTKFNEGRTVVSNDVNGYVGVVTYKWDKDNTIGINYALVQSSDTPVPGTVINALHIATTTNAVVFAADNGVDFQNLGIHANGLISGLSYEVELDTQFGNILRGSALEQKMGGYAALVNLGYKLDPVNIRLAFAYGSGDKNGLDGKVKEFQTTMGNDLHYTFIYEYLMKTAAGLQVIDASHSGKFAYSSTTGVGSGISTGIANTTYYRLGFDYAPIKDLTASLDGFILRASQTAGTVSKSIGSEVDLKIAYKIDRNLAYGFNAGYFSTGNFYNTSGLVTEAAKKNVTALMHSLTLNF